MTTHSDSTLPAIEEWLDELLSDADLETITLKVIKQRVRQEFQVDSIPNIDSFVKSHVTNWMSNRMHNNNSSSTNNHDGDADSVTSMPMDGDGFTSMPVGDDDDDSHRRQSRRPNRKSKRSSDASDDDDGELSSSSSGSDPAPSSRQPPRRKNVDAFQLSSSSSDEGEPRQAKTSLRQSSRVRQRRRRKESSSEYSDSDDEYRTTTKKRPKSNKKRATKTKSKTPKPVRRTKHVKLDPGETFFKEVIAPKFVKSSLKSIGFDLSVWDGDDDTISLSSAIADAKATLCHMLVAPDDRDQLLSLSKMLARTLPFSKHGKQMTVSSIEQIKCASMLVESLHHHQIMFEQYKFDRISTADNQAIQSAFPILGCKLSKASDGVARHIGGILSHLHGLKITSCMEVERAGEVDTYRPFAELPNQRMLWMYVDRPSLLYVLKHGCDLPESRGSPLAQFAANEFFESPTVALAQGATRVVGNKHRKHAFLLLAQVALGETHQHVADPTSLESMMVHSLTIDQDTTPSGEGMDVDKTLHLVNWPFENSNGTQYNEQPTSVRHTVLDSDQVRLRYLVQLGK